MSQISSQVRNAVRGRMADPASGFNFWLAAYCGVAPYVNADAYTIDFTDSSANFWQSNVTSEQLDATTPVDSGTICRLYTVRFVNQSGTYQKFMLFSGTVQIAVDFDIAWAEAFARTDTESLAEATEDAMVKVFNSSAYYSAFASNGILYNGQIEASRGPVRESGPGARQLVAFRLDFELQVSN